MTIWTLLRRAGQPDNRPQQDYQDGFTAGVHNQPADAARHDASPAYRDGFAAGKAKLTDTVKMVARMQGYIEEAQLARRSTVPTSHPGRGR